jgi:hypothetical protein
MAGPAREPGAVHSRLIESRGRPVDGRDAQSAPAMTREFGRRPEGEARAAATGFKTCNPLAKAQQVQNDEGGVGGGKNRGQAEQGLPA